MKRILIAGDLLYVSSDLLSGKSLPLLVGITRLPVDQLLLSLVLFMGALAGALFSVYAVRITDGRHPLVRANAVIQASASLFFSLSMALSVARGIHYERGIILSLVPAFCTVTQAVPLRESTYLVALLLVVFLSPFCFFAPAPASASPLLEQFQLPVVLQGLNPSASPEDTAAGVLDILGRALYLFVLAFYACTQHAPAESASQARLLSPMYGHNGRYALFVCLVSAWLRLVVWYFASFLSDRTMHLVLENDLSRGAWHPLVCVCFTVILLYSACWTATLLREELLPLDRQPNRLRLVAAVLCLAAYYRQRNGEALLIMGASLAGLSVLAAGAALDPHKI